MQIWSLQKNVLLNKFMMEWNEKLLCTLFLNILRRDFCLKKKQEKSNAEEGDKFKQKPVQ